MGNTEGKTPLRRFGCKWRSVIRMGIKVKGWKSV